MRTGIEDLTLMLSGNKQQPFDALTLNCNNYLKIISLPLINFNSMIFIYRGITTDASILECIWEEYWFKNKINGLLKLIINWFNLDDDDR